MVFHIRHTTAHLLHTLASWASRVPACIGHYLLGIVLETGAASKATKVNAICSEHCSRNFAWYGKYTTVIFGLLCWATTPVDFNRITDSPSFVRIGWPAKSLHTLRVVILLMLRIEVDDSLPGWGELAGWSGTGHQPNPTRESKLSDANGDGKSFLLLFFLLERFGLALRPVIAREIVLPLT